MTTAARVRFVARKLWWALRVVGPHHVAAGAARYVWVLLRRPPWVEVTLRRSGRHLRLRYPGQCVPTLIVCGDVIDPEYAFLRAVTRPDWRIVDVGAGIGQFTVYVAGLTSRPVHAIEPGRDNAETLRLNVESNGLSPTVHVHDVAVGAGRGEAHFAAGPNTFTGGLSTEGYTVRVVTLADWAGDVGLDHVEVLKVNVAGYEPEVLAGAEPLLRQGWADVLVLLIGLPSFPAYHRMAEWGYGFYFFHPRAMTLHPVPSLDEDGLVRDRPWPARHVLAVHASALDRCLAGSGIRVVGGPA